MRITIFWLTGIVFFVVQASILVRLLRARHDSGERQIAHVHTEIIWTLVPAALIAALALMATGATGVQLGRTVAKDPVPVALEAR